MLYISTYWGGRVTGYTDGSQPTKRSFFTHVLEDIRRGQREQYFIRVATSLPPASMMQDATPLPLIMRRLGELGLGVPPGGK